MTIANRTTQAELSDLQMHLLEHSFEWIAQDHSHFTKQFRKHLLRSHPDFVDLFEPLSTYQFQIMAMTSLTLLIHSLKYPEHVRVISQLLDEHQYPQDKQREMYDAYYDTLMNILSEVAEDSWSPAFQGAWKACLDLMRFQIFHCAEPSPPAPLMPDSPFDLVTRRIHSRALVVDDDEHVRKTLCSYLETQGYDCYEAENGAIALHYLEGILPIDVVVTDNHMPVLSGLQFLKAIADTPNIQHPPCIICSGNLSRDVVEKALNLGAWAIIAKPYSYENLHTTMMQAMQANPFPQTLRSRKEDQ